MFARNYFGLVSLVFYAAGAATWRIALAQESYKRMFVIAALLFAAGFVWSLGWLWATEYFRSPHRRYSRRYSDQIRNDHSDLQAHQHVKFNRERRRRRPPSGRRKYRWFAVAFSIFLLTVVGHKLQHSYRARVIEKSFARVEIFFADAPLTPGGKAPYLSSPSSMKMMIFSMRRIPTREIEIESNQKIMPFNISIRNMSGITIRNAKVLIDSDTPITGSNVTTARSSSQISVSVPEIAPYHKPADAYRLSIQMTIPPHPREGGLLVSISADNLQHYAEAANNRFIAPL